MKRWFVILIIALALILLLSPAIVGRLAERNLAENLSWVQDENADLEIEAESFERGWFNSEGRHRITLHDGTIAELVAGASGETGNGSPVLVIDTRIDHGLLPFTSLGREQGTLAPGIASAISTLKLDPGNGELLDLPGRVLSFADLTGNTEFRFLMEAGEFAERGTAMEWQGADVAVTASPARRQFAVKGEIEPVALDSFGVRTELGAVRIDAEQDLSRYNLGVGSIQLDVESFLLSSAGVPDSGFGRMSLVGDSDLDGTRLSGDVTVSIEDIATPNVGDADMQVEVALADVDAEVLGNIVRAAQAVEDSPTAAEDFMFVVQDDLQQLVAGGMTFDMRRFDLTLPAGDWQSSMKIEIPADDGAFSWPSVALRMNATANLSVSAGLFEYLMEVEPQAGAIIAMGIVVREGDRYVMRAEIDGGALTVNGAPIPLTGLLSP